jgi:hypothetical protein
MLLQLQIASKLPRLLSNLMYLKIPKIIQHINDNLSSDMMMMMIAAPKALIEGPLSAGNSLPNQPFIP